MNDVPRHATRSWLAPALLVVALLALLYVLAGLGYWRGVRGGRTISVPERYGHVWLEHQPWRMADAAPPPADPVPFAVLYGPNVVAQSFRATAGYLARVRVWLDGPPGTRVQIGLEAADEAENAATARYATWVTLRGEPGEGNDYDLTFPPLPGSKGHLYRLWVRAPEAGVEGAVALRIAPGDAVGGHPELNGYAVSGNLDFAAYHHGWPGHWWFDTLLEQVLPETFRIRIQQYKPAWLKGAAFPALAGCAALLALAIWTASWPGARGGWAWRTAGTVTLVIAGGLVWALIGGGLIWGAGSIAVAPGAEPQLGAGPRALLDAVMAKRPKDVEAAREAPPVEWVVDGTGQGRYALLTQPEQRYSFTLDLPPGAALRVGVRAAGAPLDATVWVEHPGQHPQPVWEARVGDAWQQVEIDLSAHASRALAASAYPGLVKIRLGGTGPAWWSAPHVVSDEHWLLPDPLPPEVALSPQQARFGDEIELLGYALERTEVAAGAPLILTLYWRPLRPIARDYTVFVHLVDGQGQQHGGADGYPVQGAFGTSHWPAGRVVIDRREIPWRDPTPGEYRVVVGLYWLETMERLPTLDAEGARLPADQVILETTVSVE